jgi:hypothetical protein
MAIDLGDVAAFAIQIKDATGTLANASAVTCVITLPDATTTSPTVANPTTGNYQINYPTTQVGRHSLRWIATGSNSGTYSDSFDVIAGDSGYLCSLQDLRDELNLTSTNTVHDDELRLYLSATTPIIEDIAGPQLRQTFTEQFDGGVQNIILRHAPIASVSTVIEYWGSYSFTLAQAATPSDAGQYSFTVDPTVGTITRRTPSGAATFFAAGLRNIHVTYTVGTGVVPGNVRLAARRQAAHLYRSSQQGSRPSFGTGDVELAVTPSGYAVPRAVIELVKPNRRPPGIA